MYSKKELQIVFEIAFSICGRIHCDIMQTQLQIAHLYFDILGVYVTCLPDFKWKRKVHLQLHFQCLISYDPVFLE